MPAKSGPGPSAARAAVATIESKRPSSKPRKKSGGKRPRASGVERRRHLLDAAAKLFSSQGYDGTSMRDIAAAAGILSGSIYYYFDSKEDLLLAVHEEGVANFVHSVRSALETVGNDPWDRLEAACVGHLRALLAGSDYAQVVTPQFPSRFAESLRDQMIRQRDSYETLFRGLVDALPLPADIDRRLLRLTLFGALNWALTWYRPGGDLTPESIARFIVGVERRGLDPRLKP